MKSPAMLLMLEEASPGDSHSALVIAMCLSQDHRNVSPFVVFSSRSPEAQAFMLSGFVSAQAGILFIDLNIYSKVSR